MLRIIVLLLVIIMFAVGALMWPLFKCGIKEHDFGLNTKWTLLNGCVIETKPGIFVPADKYRGTAE